MSATEQGTLAAAPVERAAAPVVELRPDGCVLRVDGEHFWLCIRRDGRTGSEMRLTAEQLADFVVKAQRVLR